MGLYIESVQEAYTKEKNYAGKWWENPDYK